MPGDALVVVPPLLKVVSGPLLGPAMLVGAARAAGHAARVVDLNAKWLRAQQPGVGPTRACPFVGDHDRPDELLRCVEVDYARKWQATAPGSDTSGQNSDYLSVRMTHDEVAAAAIRASGEPLGEWFRDALRSSPRPSVVGVSVMYTGQVLAGLVVSIVARSLWPDVLIVWGGAHATALSTEIAADARYGWFVDRFVFGYAEHTWVQLLDAVRDALPFPAAAIKAGDGTTVRASDDCKVIPAFDDLDGHGGDRLTLPAQTSRGCAYGRCAFCTYPAVEGRYRLMSLVSAGATIELADKHGAAVSFKDSLVVVPRLDTLATAIGDRVQWSACTKLSKQLDGPFLRRLADAGCATLEVGLETLTPLGQQLINKRQAWPLFVGLLDAAAAAGIALVVNYMTGLPSAVEAEEQEWLGRVLDALAARQALVAKVEHNVFELERRSPMGLSPASFGVHVTATWPWSSVMDWRLT